MGLGQQHSPRRSSLDGSTRSTARVERQRIHERSVLFFILVPLFLIFFRRLILTLGAIVNPPAPTMIAPSFPPLAKPSVFSSAPAVLPSPVVTPAPTLASAKTRARVLPSTRANIVGRADSGCTKVYITDNQRQIAENERKEKDEKEKKDKEEKDKKDKRWIWATSILQDDGFVPPAGQPTIGGINCWSHFRKLSQR